MSNRNRNPRKGAAMVEFALLIPLLGMIMVGAVDLSRVFHEAKTVADAARSGVQFGSNSNAHSVDSSGIELATRRDAVNLPGTLTVTPDTFCRCEGQADPKQKGDCSSINCPEGPSHVYVEVSTGGTFQTMIQYPGVPYSVGLQQEAVFRIQ